MIITHGELIDLVDGSESISGGDPEVYGYGSVRSFVGVYSEDEGELLSRSITESLYHPGTVSHFDYGLSFSGTHSTGEDYEWAIRSKLCPEDEGLQENANGPRM